MIAATTATAATNVFEVTACCAVMPYKQVFLVVHVFQVDMYDVP